MSKLDDVLGKIEKLFAKAESTEFVEEASALYAKAQELMTRYQIEEAMLNNRNREEQIINKLVPMKNPYIIDKNVLLFAIAKNNYCKTLRGKNYGVIYGYESDVAMVVKMYEMLSTHMINEMWTELAKFRASNSSTATVSWKKSFFSGYANEINKRLQSAKRDLINETSRSTGNDQFALVLVDKQKQVDRYWESVPKGHAAPRSISSHAGYGSGKTSGGRADLGQARLNGRLALPG